MSEFAFKRQWGPTPKYQRVLSYQRPSNEFITIAGPCSVESEQQISEIAKLVASYGANHLRGGVFRAGTYPGENFGLIDLQLIKSYHHAARSNGLKNIVEVLDYSYDSLREIEPYADCFQIGARSQQNYTLLRKVGGLGRRVFLKRSPGCTLDEFLGSAEHLLSSGCKDLVLIERGTSSLINHVRWDLSISMIPAIKAITKIPIIVDAAHGTGRRDLVGPMTFAGVAAGSDGFLVEVHTDPVNSLSDPDQAITPMEFLIITSKCNKLRRALEVECESE